MYLIIELILKTLLKTSTSNKLANFSIPIPIILTLKPI